MACFHPLHAVQQYYGDKPRNFINANYETSLKLWQELYDSQTEFPRAVLLPCGQCLGCRLTYTRNWAIRCLLESKFYPAGSCWFVTLTYDDEHLPRSFAHNPDTGEVTFETATLVKAHPQSFMKNLREYLRYHYNLTGVRVFYCGEYGSRSKRPHYHLIIFGLPTSILPEGSIVPYRYNKKLLEMPFMTKIWGKGLVAIGDLTFDSASYVAGYMLKKVKGKESANYYEQNGIIPEFSVSSRRPGLARKHFDMFSDEIYEQDSLGLKLKGNLVARPPSYFDKLYRSLHPDEFACISAKRQHDLKVSDEIRAENSGLSVNELRRKDEENLKARFSLSKKI